MHDDRWLSLRCDLTGGDGLRCRNRFSARMIATDIRADARAAGWTTVSDVLSKVFADYCPSHSNTSITIEEVDQPRLTPVEGST